MPQGNTPFLWFDGAAEEAARFYVTLLPDSHVDNIVHAPSDTPALREGAVPLVEFTLAGQKFVGLDGGPQFPFSEAVSFQIETDDQEETDRLWNAITGNGGTESMCSWCMDGWGLGWQVTPKRLLELRARPDRDGARRVGKAMLAMRKIDITALEAAHDGTTS